MDNTIAFCVATYNHPDTLRDILKRTVFMYDRYGIDIIIYDSSRTDETEKLVSAYCGSGAKNLFYVKMDSEITSSQKALHILSCRCLPKKYEYIFLLKDRIAFEEVTISLLADECRKGFDAVILPTSHFPYDAKPQPKTEVYTDAALLFRDYGVYAPDWLTMVIRYDTILRHVDYDEFVERYFTGPEHGFEQMAVLYNGLAKLPALKVRVLRENEIYGYESGASGSMWGANKYDIWAGRWLRAVDMLPDCYNEYKAYVKKKEGMQPALFGSPYSLISDAKSGILNHDMLRDIEPVWQQVSDIPYKCLEYIIDEKYNLMMMSLLEEWHCMFEQQRFDEAYHMYYCNPWLRDVIGEEQHDILGKCFEVYRQELADNDGCDSTEIFTDVHSTIQAVNRYKALFRII